MGSKICVLDTYTINKIAAGEVIENPASVVKELIENSIDADADTITIEIRGGGRQWLRVSDNGVGMSEEDAKLCFQRHATSKITSVEDILNIHTMGFRGEALPSIAAISKLTLLTSMSEKATLVKIEGGQILECASAARSTGTTIEVKSLFFNVAARKKFQFQRSPNYDVNEIQKIVTKAALAHPEIKFQLVSNHKTLLATKPLQKTEPIDRIKERVDDILGENFSSRLLPIIEKTKGLEIIGYIGQPSLTRPNRTGQFLFINQRSVISPLVSFAVRDGYGTALVTNRYPVFVLFLTMENGSLDVNVHPQKKEVRMSHDVKVRDCIIKAVQAALQERNTPFSHFPPPRIHHEGRESNWAAFAKKNDVLITKATIDTRAPSLTLVSKTPTFEELKVVATLPGFVVLYSNEKRLHFLDQMAAQSRILYDQIACKAEQIPKQTLLIPKTIQLATLEAAILKTQLETLNRLGIEIEEFGPSQFIVRSHSQLFANAEIENLLLNTVQELYDTQSEKVLEKEIQKKLIKTLVRQWQKNKQLTFLEGQFLYDQLMKCNQPYSCPEGKRIIITLDQRDIAKHFQNSK